MTDRLDSQIRQLVGEIVAVAPDELEPPSLSDVEIPVGNDGRGPARAFHALALAAVVLVVVGVATSVGLNWFDDRQGDVAAGVTTATVGMTYRFEAKTTIMKADTEFESSQEQAEADSQTEPARGPEAEGRVDLVNGRSDLRLVTTHDGFIDRLMEPSDPLAVRQDGNVIVTEVDGQFYELNPFVASGVGVENGFGALFPEATKTLDGASEVFDQPNWVEVGTEVIDGMPTTHLRADVEVNDGGEIFVSNSLLGLTTIYGDWDGQADIWLGGDGLTRRVIIVVNDEGRTDTLRLDYFDYDAPVDIEWPPITPGTPGG